MIHIGKQVLPVGNNGILGEAPLAFIATRQNVAPDISDILAFCRSRLQAHKVPVDFVTLPSIPKSGIGKIDKLSLRQLAAEYRGKSGPRGSTAAGVGGGS